MKIKELPSYQRKALLASLAKNQADADCEIEFTDKISLRRLSSLWYGGSVAEVHYKGYIFCVDAIGDVYADIHPANVAPEDREYPLAYVKDKNNGGYFSNEMLCYLRSDAALSAALGGTHPKYCLEMDHNNWWECFVVDPEGVKHDIMWALDDDNLFDAIAGVIIGMDDAIFGLAPEEFYKWTSKSGTPYITVHQIGNSECKFDDGTPVFKDGSAICSISFKNEEEREKWLAKNRRSKGGDSVA